MQIGQNKCNKLFLCLELWLFITKEPWKALQKQNSKRRYKSKSRDLKLQFDFFFEVYSNQNHHSNFIWANRFTTFSMTSLGVMFSLMSTLKVFVSSLPGGSKRSCIANNSFVTPSPVSLPCLAATLFCWVSFDIESRIKMQSGRILLMFSLELLEAITWDTTKSPPIFFLWPSICFAKWVCFGFKGQKESKKKSILFDLRGNLD